jgi:hypothetical protein
MIDYIIQFLVFVDEVVVKMVVVLEEVGLIFGLFVILV